MPSPPPEPFAKALLAWYARERRDLPWRATKDPYRIWVSEIMLQQTQVATVIPYYGRFLKRFPTLKALALADRESVLKAWEGLGYYRRAVHLHEGVRAVLTRHAGRFPSDPGAIRTLPGIGDYTAGAIRSIALGQDAALVDGNVARVLARIAALRRAVQEAATKKSIWTLAASLLPPGRAGDFNQALMELGALVCTPRDPRCRVCPVTRFCRARKEKLTDRIPARVARKALPQRREAVAVLSRGETLYLRRRPEGGLLGGLWEFPSVPDPGERAARDLLDSLFRRHGVRARSCGSLGRFHHAFTHFKLEAEARTYEAAGKGREVNGRRWVDAATLDELPVTRMTRRIHEAWIKRQEAPLPLFETKA
jgi:A/G-specific adenine glycosylase